MFGEIAITPHEVASTLANRLFGFDLPVDPIREGIIWHYRLGRAAVAVCAGASLAICGVVLQALLRNPLAEPYLLGISAGASTGAVMVIVLALAYCLYRARALDAFAFGEDAAASLGVDMTRVRIELFALTAMLTATMVSVIAAVGFVGLVIPHAARLDHRSRRSGQCPLHLRGPHLCREFRHKVGGQALHGRGCREAA